MCTCVYLPFSLLGTKSRACTGFLGLYSPQLLPISPPLISYLSLEALCFLWFPDSSFFSPSFLLVLLSTNFFLLCLVSLIVLPPPVPGWSLGNSTAANPELVVTSHWLSAAFRLE
ncbi:hypothetical protein F5Y08DRAFT_157374 [Xylaria arbuscula]|nr:hypothetical protein F5Y08DRAFT_157374 [Xylaria arbuscula]